MERLTYAETLASTRAGVRRLNELAAAARTAAKEVAQTAKETAQTAVGTAAAAAQTAKETAANAAQSAAQTAKEAAASAEDRHQHAPKHQARQRRTGPIKPIANKHALRHARRGASFLRRWFLAKTATPLSKLRNYGSTYINYIDMLIITTSITPKHQGTSGVPQYIYRAEIPGSSSLTAAKSMRCGTPIGSKKAAGLSRPCC